MYRFFILNFAYHQETQIKTHKSHLCIPMRARLLNYLQICCTETFLLMYFLY